VLKQAVKRNMTRFPQDFMFQLTAEEWAVMSSQIVTTLPVKRPKKALPYAFTEHGVVMLSSVLHSETAIQVNIAVTRAFVAVRQMIAVSPVALRLSVLEKNFSPIITILTKTRGHSLKPSIQLWPNFRRRSRWLSVGV